MLHNPCYVGNLVLWNFRTIGRVISPEQHLLENYVLTFQWKVVGLPSYGLFASNLIQLSIFFRMVGKGQILALSWKTPVPWQLMFQAV